MIRPICSQLILRFILLLALAQACNIVIGQGSKLVLTQEYSVEQIQIGAQQLYVADPENGIYTQVNLHHHKTVEVAIPMEAQQPGQHHQVQQQNHHHHHQQHQHHQHINHHQYQHQHQNEQFPPVQKDLYNQYNLQQRQQILQQMEAQQVQDQHNPAFSQHMGQPVAQDQLASQPTQNHQAQQYNQHQNVHPHQQYHNHIHHEEQLQIVYREQQHEVPTSTQIHHQQHIKITRESTNVGEIRELFIHQIETKYPISRYPNRPHTGSCDSLDDSSILMMRPQSDFGEPTCQANHGTTGGSMNEHVAEFAQHHHPNKPSRNSNVESFPLVAPHHHYESSLMTAIRHYWREISGLCLASAIFLNWLFVVVKRRFEASGFTRQVDVTAEQVVETIQRYSISSNTMSTPKSISKDSNVFNGSAHDSAFEETASPIDLDNTSSSNESSLNSRPKSISSSIGERNNTSQPNSSPHGSPYTFDYISRYSSDFDSIRRLGRGGFGIVFEAKNKIDDCHYAVKRICLPLEKEARERVMREVRALAKLDHAGIVRYYNAWLETPPDDWLKQHDAQLGIIHTRDDGLSFPSTDGIYDKNGSGLNTRGLDRDVRDNNFDKFAESGDLSNDYYGTRGPFKHLTNGYQNCAKDNSSSPSLDIVFEGSGSIRLEAENNKEESDERQHNNSSSLPAETSGLHVEKVYLYIQMQLCRKDTLKDWLKTNCENRDKTTIFDFFYQIVDAVEYVHSQDLIHRDLKVSLSAEYLFSKI